MDGFIEQLVKRERTSRETVKTILIILATIAVPFIFVFISMITKIGYFIIVGLFSILFCVYGLWYFLTALNVEYEYSIVDSFLVVDKIIAKRKRKRVIKVDAKNIEQLYPVTTGREPEGDINKCYYVCSNEKSPDNYYLVFRTEQRGTSVILFTPKEKILNGLKPYLKREIVVDLFYKK